jgi:hypothetical protein
VADTPEGECICTEAHLTVSITERTDVVCTLVAPAVKDVASFTIKLICMLLKPLAKGLQKVPVLGFFNKLTGAAFGLVNMWIYSSVLCMVLALPSIPWGMDVLELSLFKSTSLFTDMIAEKIEISDEDVQNIMNQVNQFQNLDEETIQQIQDFLSQYGVTQAQIDALFENLE